MKFIIFALLLYVSILLQVAALPALNLDRLNFNFPLVFLAALTAFRPRDEILFWSLIVGALLDSLSAFSFNYTIFILPALALLGQFLVTGINPKPRLAVYLMLVAGFITINQLLVFLTEISWLNQDSHYFSQIIQNSPRFLKEAGLALIFNCGLLAFPSFLLFSRLNEFFEYREQRKRI